MMLSLVPLFSLLGNILPSFSGFRLHQLWNGTIFLLSLFFIKRDNWILFILFAVYTILMSFFYSFKAIFVLIDHFSGLMVVLNILGNARFKELRVNNLTKLFVLMSLIPVLLAFLQIANIAPYEIGNTGYVNFAIFQGEIVKRPNGGLFHPYELVIFTYMPFVLLYHKYKNVSMLLIAIPVLYIVKIKTGIFLVLSYILVVGLKLYRISWPKVVTFQRLFLFCFPIIVAFLYYNIDLVLKVAGVSNSQEFLTGRGIIWQIYITSFLESHWMTKVFGFWDITNIIPNSGMYYNKDYNPGPHNSYLEMLMYCGFVGLVFLYVFMKRIFKSITDCLGKTDTMKLVYFAIVLVLLTLAMTGDMLYTFYFYTGIIFIIKNSYSIHTSNTSK